LTRPTSLAIYPDIIYDVYSDIKRTIVAEMTFKAKGRRWPALARRVVAENPGAELVPSEDGQTLIVRGPHLLISRKMVEETCFPDGVRNAGTVTRLLYGIALSRKGRLVVKTDDRIVIGDDDGERAMSLRLRVDHQAAIARLSKELGMSRNEFVVKAVEHFCQYLEASRDLPALDG